VPLPPRSAGAGYLKRVLQSVTEVVLGAFTIFSELMWVAWQI
jgi:hypothetical protein